MDFLTQIIGRAKEQPKRIVLPESSDPRVVEAAAEAIRLGIAKIVLIGKKEEIQKVAPQHDVSAATFYDPASYPDRDSFVSALVELRRHKGMDAEQARQALLSPTTFGVMLVKQGLADGLVAGSVGSTADTLRPALQILRTKPGLSLVSSFFMMVVPRPQYGEDGTILFADCALNEYPDAPALAQIAVASAASFAALTGRTPRVAMLSYSTLASAQSEHTEKMVEATRLARELAPDQIIAGELQADAAIEAAVGRLKAAQSPIQGDANCLIFPNLDAGNIGYKLVERLAGAAAYGPLLQGIAKPVNDLSRGCSAADIVGVVAITCVQAQAEEEAC